MRSSMKPFVRGLADRAQRMAARSSMLVRLAVLLRNQCRCIIKYRLAESPDVNETGEVWLRHALAARCMTFADVGANVGDWLEQIALEKSTQPFRAIAYEPSSSAFERLSARFGSDSRVTLRPCAAGDAAGELEFSEEPAAGKGSSLVGSFSAAQTRKRSVRVVRLDDEIAVAGWERVDFLKIDAEGYDMRVLAGARGLLERQRIGVVQFEYNRAWQLAGDTLFSAIRLLNASGYEVFVLKRDGLYTLDYALYEEYFEYSNFVALSEPFMDLKAAHFRGVI